jgi:hypothetical protein
MVRCEEIFRQICWLEERFWPDVDGMGEQDETANLGPAGLSAMNNGTFTGPMNQNMGGPMNNNPMGGPMNGQMNGQMSNGQMSGPMHNTGMNGPMANGPMANGPIGSQMNGNMNGAQMNGNLNGNQMTSAASTPGADSNNGFGQMTQIAQGS